MPKDHGYYHNLLVPGECRKVLESGEPCGVPFVGPRVQKYCSDHQMPEKQVKRNRAQRRHRAVERVARKVMNRAVND
jgi:hypothetical protein